MERIRNVVVFGDSLSDIGTKWKTFMGKVAVKLKQMTDKVYEVIWKKVQATINDKEYAFGRLK